MLRAEKKEKYKCRVYFAHGNTVAKINATVSWSGKHLGGGGAAESELVSFLPPDGLVPVEADVVILVRDLFFV